MNKCETCKCNKVCDRDFFGFENCDNYISEDCAEVVRCRDCKHWKRIAFDDIIECDFGICHNPYDETEKETIERDYCSDGERKGGEAE